MKKNDIFTLTVTDISSDGFGVGRVGQNSTGTDESSSQQVVFVLGAAVGDVADVRVLKVKPRYAYAKIEKLIHPSPFRLDEADCAVFGRCGGCDFRHMTYAAELTAKRGFVVSAFHKAGLDVNVVQVDETVPSKQIDCYRNKAQFPVGKDKDGKPQFGYFRRHSHEIIPAGHCRLNEATFMEIADFIMNAGLSPYDEESHTGVLRHICIRQGHYSKEICVSLVVRRKVPELKYIARMLCDKFHSVVGVTANINPERTNVIWGAREILLCGRNYINDIICGMPVSVSQQSFYQVNTPIAERMYQSALEYADVAVKTVLDLYSGAGFFGLLAAKMANKVVGMEINPVAVADAKRNALQNRAVNIECIEADADSPEAVSAVITELQPDVIFLDPARTGCSAGCLSAVADSGAEKIVMMSCNPATAARDCKILCEGGYALERIIPADMFPRTKHVEMLALLRRDKV
jgi:23S rRNA (uracil1939-C5)-methyltransferase